MRGYRPLFLFAFMLLSMVGAKATHITGGDLTYKCINPATNTYEVSVTVYRDCINGQAAFDGTIRLFIFRNSNKTLYNSISISLNQSGVQIIPIFWNSCTGIPQNVCVEYVTYTANVSLPPSTGGFTVGWARCCRNNIVTNIGASQGITTIGNIPGPEAGACNSMPTFNLLPPIFLCVGQAFTFDHSATDVDGDSLVYQITNPLTGTNFNGDGATQFQPTVGVGGLGGGNPMGPPPYNNVTFLPGFSFLNPFGSGNFNMDPQSGLLTLTPTQIGLSVFAVSVREYRNGVFISENIRDFQISVINCVPQGSPPVIASNLPPIPGVNGDTIRADVDQDLCFTMTLTDPVPNSVVRLFPVSSSFGIGGTFQGPFATLTQNGDNPANGTVCWKPNCTYAGDTILIVVGGRDTADCPGYNIVFDTTYVILNPINEPVITHTLPNGTSSDTLVLNPNQAACVTYSGTDINLVDSLVFLPIAGPLPNLGGTASFSSSGVGNNISGTLCWTPSCADAGQSFDVIIQVQDTNRCLEFAQDTLTIVVNPLVPIGATGDTTICIGTTVPLAAFGGASYSWSPTVGLSNANIASPTATPAVTTTYIVTITDAVGCVRTDSAEVIVNPLPVVNAGPNVTKCPGFPVQLQATGGLAYSWSPAFGLSNPNISNPIADPLITTTYTVTVTDKNGCVNTDDIKVKVMNIDAGTGGFICLEDSIQLAASGGSTYQWNPTTGLSNPSIANPKASPAVTTLYTVTFTDPTGCVDTDTVTVGVYPTIQPEAGLNDALCVGDSLTLTASGGVGYAWTGSTAMIDANTANPTVFPTSTTWFYVTVTDANGCVGTDSVLITVNPLPIPFAGNDTAKCGDQGIQLTATGGAAYRWTPGLGLDNRNIATPIANPDSSRTYEVRVTDANGCSAIDSLFVRVMYADAGPDLPVCIGDSVAIQASGGISYMWNASPFLTSTNTASTLAFPAVDTDFIVTVTDTVGCTDTDTMSVTVNPLPITTTFGTDPYVCSGGGTVVNATGGVQYAWSPAGIFNDPTLASPIASPTYSGTTLDSTVRFYVTVTDINGCSSDDSLDQVVRLLPIISFSNDTVNCPGGSVPLFGNGGPAITWSPAYALNTTIGPNVIASPDTTTTYNVRIEAVWGCADSADIEVIVMVPEAGPNDTICRRDSVMLLGGGGAAYSWSPVAGLDDPFSATPMASPDFTTTYTVTVTDSLGCVDTDTVRITVNQLPPADAGPDLAICIGDSISFTASGGISYEWINTDSLSSPLTATTVAWPQNTTLYPVAVTDINGCTELDSMTLTVNPLPTPDAGPDQTQCGEDSIQLVATGGIMYEWSPLQGLGTPLTAMTMADPDSSRMYTVTVTDVNGCVNTDSVFIQTMYATVGPDITTCPEDPVVLSASVIGGQAASFSWNPITGLSDPTLANPTALPGVSTTYQVTITDTSGCVDTASQFVFSYPVPAADAGPDTEICFGDSITLNASGGVIYEWDRDPTLSDRTIANPLAVTLVSNTYRVMVTDANGCNLADTVRITVNPLPIVEAGLDTTICGRDPAFLLASGANTYQWTPAASLDNPAIASPVATPDADQLYLVIGTDLKGCQNSDSVTVNVRPIPVLSGDDFYEICLGQTAFMVVDGADSYLWNTGDELPILEVDPEFTSDYWVIPVGPTGCQGDRLDIEVYVERELPIAELEPSVTEGFYPLEVQFSNLSRNASNFVWQFGDGGTDSTDAPSYLYNRPGQYVITLTADNDIGCPDSVQFSFVDALDFVAFFPNAFTPNGDGENDIFQLVIRSFQSSTFQVFDRWGKKVYQSDSPDIRWDGTANGSGEILPEGVYVYTFNGTTYLGEVIERNGSITLLK